ncbi:hypothetical protein QAD02_001089 [Eretmocerus hayati]|uniref:Uncharacterized protein n=1 Tax=Eretmocerus hayati TaxID=131215 RepID=A0ACC2NF95_9HYME|nr:hypothetical protein QAD02_001089 [Eretmocerus hayati]
MKPEYDLQGKTTMIYRFLEKDDVPKPTLAMDYSYGRKAGKSLIKDVVHVWEVGHLSSSLISSAMTGCCLGHSPHHTTILIMLDLSKPQMIWNTLDECLQSLREAMEISYSTDQLREMRDRKIENLQSGSSSTTIPNTSSIFPMRLCLIGGRYDEFRSRFDEDERQLIGQTLRAAALTLGAALHYHSAKDSQLLRRTKEMLSSYGFKGQQPTRSNATDYDSALWLGAGCDSADAIGSQFGRAARTSLDAIKKVLESRQPWPPQISPRFDERSVGILDSSLRKDEFAEPLVDRMALQREQEISVLLRDMLEAPPTTVPVPGPY